MISAVFTIDNRLTTPNSSIRMHVWIAGRPEPPLIIEGNEAPIELSDNHWLVARIFLKQSEKLQDLGRVVLPLTSAWITRSVKYPNDLALESTGSMTLTPTASNQMTLNPNAPILIRRRIWVGESVFALNRFNNLQPVYTEAPNLILRLGNPQEFTECQKMIEEADWQIRLRSIVPAIEGLSAPFANGPDEACIPGTGYILQSPSDVENPDILLRALINSAARHGLVEPPTEPSPIALLVFLEFLQSTCTHVRYKSDTALNLRRPLSPRLVERYSNDCRLLGTGDCEDMSKEIHMLFCTLRDLPSEHAESFPALALTQRYASQYAALLAFVGATSDSLKGSSGPTTTCHSTVLLIPKRLLNRMLKEHECARMPQESLVGQEILIVEGTNVKNLHDHLDPRPNALTILHTLGASSKVTSALRFYRRDSIRDFYRELVCFMTTDIIRSVDREPILDFYVCDRRKPGTYGVGIHNSDPIRDWRLFPVYKDRSTVTLALGAIALEQPIPCYQPFDLATEEEEADAFNTLHQDKKQLAQAGPIKNQLIVARSLPKAFQTGKCRFIRTERELLLFNIRPSFFLSNPIPGGRLESAVDTILMNASRVSLVRIDRSFSGLGWGAHIVISELE